jgi:hypothetical protein
MALTSMKLTKKEAGTLLTPEAAAVDDRPEYPYGLQIGLDDESLGKLVLTELPAVDAVIDLTARAVVQAVRVEKYQNGKTERRVDLQITDLDLTPCEGSSTAQRLYDHSGMGA